MSDREKVVFLAFNNPRMIPEGRDLTACSTCRNKTFIVVHEGAEKFPMLQCPACGAHIGRIGWADGIDLASP